MLGQIESFRRDIGVGVIRCENGRKVRFVRDHLVNARDRLVGEEVDFYLDGRTPHAIVVLAGSPWSVFAGKALEFPAPKPEPVEIPEIDWPLAA